VTLWKAHAGAGFLAGPVTLWQIHIGEGQEGLYAMRGTTRWSGGRARGGRNRRDKML